MNRTLRAGAAALLLVTLAAGCKADSDQKQSQSTSATSTQSTPAPDAMGPPTAAQEASIKSKPGKLVTLPDGLKYQDLKVGSGPTPQAGQSVTVNYVGTLTDGTKFDASADHGGTFTFTIGQGQVIKGWDEGVISMKVGGKRKLICPPDLAYGANSPSPAIPPNSTLIFVVDLISVQ